MDIDASELSELYLLISEGKTEEALSKIDKDMELKYGLVDDIFYPYFGGGINEQALSDFIKIYGFDTQLIDQWGRKGNLLQQVIKDNKFDVLGFRNDLEQFREDGYIHTLAKMGFSLNPEWSDIAPVWNEILSVHLNQVIYESEDEEYFDDLLETSWQMIELGNPINSDEQNSYESCFHLLASKMIPKDFIQFTDQFKDKGADIHSVSTTGKNIAFYALGFDDDHSFKDFKNLVEHFEIDIHQVSNSGNTIIHELLLEFPKYRKNDTSLNIKDELLRYLEYFNDRGLDLNAQDSQGFTPVCLLFMNSLSMNLNKEEFFEVIKKMILMGANIDIQDNHGRHLMDLETLLTDEMTDEILILSRKMQSSLKQDEEIINSPSIMTM